MPHKREKNKARFENNVVLTLFVFWVIPSHTCSPQKLFPTERILLRADLWRFYLQKVSRIFCLLHILVALIDSQHLHGVFNVLETRPVPRNFCSKRQVESKANLFPGTSSRAHMRLSGVTCARCVCFLYLPSSQTNQMPCHLLWAVNCTHIARAGN